MKMAVFRDVAPCGLIETDRHTEVCAAFISLIALMIEAANTSETCELLPDYTV
jgi:hypothetical protein